MDRLISGGQVRRRRRNLARVGGAALALVLIGGGVYGVMQIDRAGAQDPTGRPPPKAPPAAVRRTPAPRPSSPGTYRMPRRRRRSGATIEADLTFEGSGWKAGNFPDAQTRDSTAGSPSTAPMRSPAESGCNGDLAIEPATPRRRSRSSSPRCRRSTVVQPVPSTEVLGRDAVHLRVRIPQDCPMNEAYRVAETPRGSRGISSRPAPPDVVMDFWVMEEAGVAVVLDSWHEAGASSVLLDEVAEATEATRFVTP